MKLIDVKLIDVKLIDVKLINVQDNRCEGNRCEVSQCEVKATGGSRSKNYLLIFYRSHGVEKHAKTASKIFFVARAINF